MFNIKYIFKDFIKFSIDSLLIVILMFLSFLLIINLFHYKEMNYKYNLTQEEIFDLESIKNNVNDVYLNVNSIDISKINDGVKQNIANQFYNKFNSCYDSINNGLLFNFKKEYYVDYNSLFSINNDLMNDINTKCLFLLPYSISENIGNSNLDNTEFSIIEDKMFKDKDQINFIASNTNNLLLSNSNYSFISDISRNSIYNPVKSNYKIIFNNYQILIDDFILIGNWYVSYFGGVQ